MKNDLGRRAICGRCDLEIERHPPLWIDRGGNSHCASGPLHLAAGENVWTLLGDTAKRHMRSICSDNVTRSTVIGLRKGFNHVARLEQRLSGNRSSVTREDAAQWREAIGVHMPRVTGELDESGRKLLRSKRYAKRLAPVAGIIADLACFRLVGFEAYDSSGLHFAPIFRAYDSRGRHFTFRNLPWQAVAYSREELESGPVVLGSDMKGLGDAN